MTAEPKLAAGDVAGDPARADAASQVTKPPRRSRAVPMVRSRFFTIQSRARRIRWSRKDVRRLPERHVAALRDDLEPAVREQDADHSASDAEPVTYTMQDECRDGYATATLRQSHPSRRSRTTAAAAVRLNAAGGVNRCADGSSANHAGEEAARAGRERLGSGRRRPGG